MLTRRSALRLGAGTLAGLAIVRPARDIARRR